MKRLAIICAFVGITVLAACGPAQSPACATYMVCQAAVDELAGTSIAAAQADTYGETGTCWTTTEAAADACSDACAMATESNANAYADVAECDATA